MPKLTKSYHALFEQGIIGKVDFRALEREAQAANTP